MSTPKSYIYEIEVDRTATPSVRGIFYQEGNQAKHLNFNSSLNSKDIVTFKVNVKNFSNPSNVAARISTAKSIGAEKVFKTATKYDKSMFKNGNKEDNNWIKEISISVGTPEPTLEFDPLTVTSGPSVWHLTAAFYVEDDNGCYSCFLPDPEPVVGPGDVS